LTSPSVSPSIVPMRHRLLVWSFALCLVPACTTRGLVRPDGGGTGTDGGASGDAGATSMDAGPPGDACGSPTTGQVQCESIYVITGANPPELYRFDPACLAFESIGTVHCPQSGPFPATPYSMAVDRNGLAWVVFTDGHIFNVDVTTAACTATSYVPNQHGYSTFGMGFSSDTPMGTTETLYVSRSVAPFGLASIETSSLTLTPIGTYDQLQARAEMTGTGDARLFGAFEGTPFIVAEIDKTNAHILSQAPQSASQASANFAFATYAGDFYLFVGPGSYTDVVRYRPSTMVSERVVAMFPQEIVGAGVSTCAPPM
jgi:hypothetical protein